MDYDYGIHLQIDHKNRAFSVGKGLQTSHGSVMGILASAAQATTRRELQLFPKMSSLGAQGRGGETGVDLRRGSKSFQMQ